MTSFSVYIHIPFCTHRCGYCDFNTYSGLEALIPTYVDALVKEIRCFSESANNRIPVHTVFFGGGTPSLLPIHLVEKILNSLDMEFDVAEDVEITLEANPGTLSQDHLSRLRSVGVNRLSIGVQSAKPEELQVLERHHDFKDVIESLKWARMAAFENVNLDWIYGLPGQTIADWKRNLELAISLEPEHLSLYALSIEHGTPFKELNDRGLLHLPDGDLAADMYELAIQKLGAAGFIQYEISSWAQPDALGKPRGCRHNLQYWRNLPYVGFGAGAHGYVAGVRLANTLSPRGYIHRLRKGVALEFPRTPATASFEIVDSEREMSETMMMGFRLVQEGISKTGFLTRFNKSLEESYGSVVQRLLKNGLLANGGGDSIRLTHRGKFVGNKVFMEFV
jgi:oxygen-independent coproporphyrinogen III oxidase